MPKVYSKDLRERVARAYLNTDMSASKVAQLFEVSIKSVERWAAFYKEHGHCTPPVLRGGPKPKLGQEHHQMLLTWLEDTPQLTDAELATRLHEHFGIVVHPSTVWRHVKELGLTRKKTHRDERQQRPDVAGRRRHGRSS